jgi:ACT domain-containing protein
MMLFRQPNNLAPLIHRAISLVERGQAVRLQLQVKDREELQRVLDLIDEIAEERNLLVRIVAVNRRTLEVTRIPIAA